MTKLLKRPASWLRKHQIAIASTGGAITLLIVTLSNLLPAKKAELPGLIQACSVIISLAIALAVFRSDSAAKKTDRVHELHHELTTGEVGAARARLGHFLRVQGDGDTVRQVSVSDLELEGDYPKYGKEDKEHMPRRDATTVLRFFERARFAQLDGAVDDRAFLWLVGYQAIWWALAITHRGAQLTYSTWQLALWAEAYIDKHREADQELEMLTRQRTKSFPEVALPKDDSGLSARH